MQKISHTKKPTLMDWKRCASDLETNLLAMRPNKRPPKLGEFGWLMIPTSPPIPPPLGPLGPDALAPPLSRRGGLALLLPRKDDDDDGTGSGDGSRLDSDPSPPLNVFLRRLADDQAGTGERVRGRRGDFFRTGAPPSGGWCCDEPDEGRGGSSSSSGWWGSMMGNLKLSKFPKKSLIRGKICKIWR